MNYSIGDLLNDNEDLRNKLTNKRNSKDNKPNNGPRNQYDQASMVVGAIVLHKTHGRGKVVEKNIETIKVTFDRPFAPGRIVRHCSHGTCTIENFVTGKLTVRFPNGSCIIDADIGDFDNVEIIEDNDANLNNKAEIIQQIPNTKKNL